MEDIVNFPANVPDNCCEQLKAVVQPVAALVFEHDLVVLDERNHENDGLSGCR